MIKRILLWLMIIHVKNLKKERDKQKNRVVVNAYDVIIKNYEDTILFLRAEIF